MTWKDFTWAIPLAVAVIQAFAGRAVLQLETRLRDWVHANYVPREIFAAKVDAIEITIAACNPQKD